MTVRARAVQQERGPVGAGLLALATAMRLHVQHALGLRTGQGAAAKRRTKVRIGAAAAVVRHEAVPAQWSLESLRALEWKRFELLCARYYAAAGFRTLTLSTKADGSNDFMLYKGSAAQPLAIVQCKTPYDGRVGAAELRALLAAMREAGIGRGIFVTNGVFDADALAVGAASPLQLLGGQAILDRILALDGDQQAKLRESAFAGDYRTPTCPTCGDRLVSRAGKRGAFWTCRHYPRCKTWLPHAGQGGGAAVRK